MPEDDSTADESTPEDELPNLALALGLRSYANQLACHRVLGLMQSRLSDKPDKAEKDKKPEKDKKKDKEKEKKDHE